MRSIAQWAIDNATFASEEYQASHDIPFSVWKRQWQIYEFIGYRQGSERLVEKMKVLAQKDRRYRPWYLYYRSIFESYQGEFRQSQETLGEVTPEEWNSLSALDQALFLMQMSEASQHLSKYDQAIDYRRQAMDIFLKHGDNNAYAKNLSQIGLIKWKKGEYLQALDDLDESIKMLNNTNDIAAISSANTNKANVYLAIEETDKACRHYQEALALNQRIGDVARQSAILNNLGAVFFRQGDFAGALEFYQRGYKIDEMLGNLPGQAAKLSNMAVMSATMGNYQEALAKFERALALERKTGNLDGQMRKLSNLASLYGLMDDSRQALECIKEAVEISRGIGAKGYLSYCLSMLGEFLSGEGRLEEAEASLMEAMDLVKGSGNLSIMANCHSHLADVYLAQGKISQALESSARAIDIVENNQLFEVNREAIFYLHHRILSQKGQNEEARNWLERAHQEVMARLEKLPPGVAAGEIINKNITLRQIVEDWEKQRREE